MCKCILQRHFFFWVHFLIFPLNFPWKQTHSKKFQNQRLSLIHLEEISFSWHPNRNQESNTVNAQIPNPYSLLSWNGTHIDPHSFMDLSHRLSTPLTLRGNGDWGLLCLFDALRLHCIYDCDYEDYLFGYQEKMRGLIFGFELFYLYLFMCLFPSKV